MRYWLKLLLIATLAMLPVVAQAWTTEYDLHPGIEWAGGQPNLETDASGRIHLAYTPTPAGEINRILYRYLEDETWSDPQDLPGDNNKEPGCDMVVSPSGIVHVVGIFRVGGSGAYTVYYWEYNGSAWSGPTMVSSGAGGDADNAIDPHVAVDRLGDVHVVWTQDNMVGGEADIMYRKRENSVWQPTQNITSNYPGTSYGSVAPNLAVDASGDTVHVVWHDDFLNNGFQAYYTKNTNLGDPGAWLPSGQWKQLNNTVYGKVPKIFLDNNDYPNVFWLDRFGGSQNVQAYSRWTGSQWTEPENWGQMDVRNANFDNSNTMHMVYAASTADAASEIFYRWYKYSGQSNSELVSSGPNTNKAYDADITLDLDEYPHVVWVERKDIGGTEECYVFYSHNRPPEPPGPVSSFTAQGGNQEVSLFWTNPSDREFSGTMIRVKTDGFPVDPQDGQLVVDKAAEPGSQDSYVHSGLVNGMTYYYAAFAHTDDPLNSTSAEASAVPHVPGDFDVDNDVDMEDFGALQLCLTGSFNPLEGPACADALMDADEDVDQDDVSLFKGCLSGPGRIADPDCIP